MSYSTKGIADGKYIEVGINDVTITNVEGNEAEGNSKPTVYVTFKQNGTSKETTTRFSFSDTAVQYSLRKLKHLATKLEGVTEAMIDAIDEPTATTWAAAYKKLVINKGVRVKFSGEEIDGESRGKKNWVKATIGFPPFAENIKVPAANTTLTFDANKDIKKLARTTATPGNNTTPADALPF